MSQIPKVVGVWEGPTALFCRPVSGNSGGIPHGRQTLQSKLDDAGELMVSVAEFDQPLELHLHDSEIGHETSTLQLSDGKIEFDIDEVTGAWKHTHSLAD